MDRIQRKKPEFRRIAAMIMAVSHDYFRDTVSGRAVSCNSGGSSKDVGNVDIHGYDV